MGAVDISLLQSLQTAAAQIDYQNNVNFLVGQSTNLYNRQLQAIAQNRVLAARDNRTYIANLYRDLLDANVRIYSGMAGGDVARLAAQQAAGGMVDVTKVIAQNYGRLIRSRRGTFANANREVGREANRAAATAQQARSLGGSGFRSGVGNIRFRRYAGGQLAAALLSDENFIARPDGLFWVVAPHLDAKAPQWYRLNFGAGSIGSATNGSRSFTVTFLGQNVGTIGFSSYRSSPSFSLPAGFFSKDGSWTGRTATGAGRGQAFRPIAYNTGQIRGEQTASLQSRAPFITRQQKSINNEFFSSRPIPTQGIRAQNFLDAGMGSIARTWPVAQARVIGDIFKESIQSGGTSTVISVSGVDLEDQKRFAFKVEREFSQAVNRLSRGRGGSSVSSAFLNSVGR